MQRVPRDLSWCQKEGADLARGEVLLLPPTSVKLSSGKIIIVNV